MPANWQTNNRTLETLFEDVRSMDKNWAKNFVSDAITLEAKCIMVISGFPCKGLSKARGENRENLQNKDSILFYEATRILELIRQAAGGKIIVRHIIENVITDEDPRTQFLSIWQDDQPRYQQDQYAQQTETCYSGWILPSRQCQVNALKKVRSATC